MLKDIGEDDGVEGAAIGSKAAQFCGSVTHSQLINECDRLLGQDSIDFNTHNDEVIFAQPPELGHDRTV